MCARVCFGGAFLKVGRERESAGERGFGDVTDGTAGNSTRGSAGEI